MSALTDRITKRIAELSVHQAEIQARADKEKAAVQGQIDALIDAKTALEADPRVEAIFLKLDGLKILPRN